MRLSIEKNVNIPMRDGVDLRADIYRPDVATPQPTLVQRTPYNKESLFPTNSAIDTLRATQHGFAVVVQDVRGRFASEGKFEPFIHEARDGVDTYEWVSKQPWSTGRIGGIGLSYFGATQWLPAARAPEPLLAIAPVLTSDSYLEGWMFQGGVLQLGFVLYWSMFHLGLGEALRSASVSEQATDEVRRAMEMVDSIDDLFWELPVAQDPRLHDLAPYVARWLEYRDARDYLASVPEPSRSYELISVPSLNIGGWFDIFLRGTLANFIGMRQRGGSPLARQSQLVVGPWAHRVLGGTYCERSFGLAANADFFDLTGRQLRWFDHYLRGEPNGVDTDPPVHIFVMGENRWRHADNWPLPETEYRSLYLHSGGRANTRSGDGVLSLEPPTVEPEDVYRYDPRDPVPSRGGSTFLPGLRVGANAGPRDQGDVEDRHDVLCYQTAVLNQAITIIGPLEVVLYVSSSAVDTDFTAKLVDVWPDGRAESVAEGIIRACYRESFSEPTPLRSNRVEEVRIDLGATAMVFAAEHRIRLEISSSNFPQFERNPNTGSCLGRPQAVEPIVAINRIHHTSGFPSRMALPIIPQD